MIKPLEALRTYAVETGAPPMTTAAGAPVRSEALIGQIADEVFAAIRDATPFKWTTWDSWAGRTVFHERDTKRDAVIEVLKRHWPNNAVRVGE
jgi:hypothetical protein